MIKLPGSGPEPQASQTGHPRKLGRLIAGSGLLLLLATASSFVAVSAVALAATGSRIVAAAPAKGTATAPAVNLSPIPATASPAATHSPVPSVTPIGDASPSPAVTASPTTAPTPTALPPTAKPAAVRPAVSIARNRFDIPGLRIDAPIGVTTCGGLIPNGIWKWPCAGQNNLYLLGHAWGVFKPLHDGYHAGLLTPGLTALYTDGSGVVHRYQLLWVEHLTVAVWGQGATWAATSGPVITLQTCDGATDGYRIIARFVPA
jgi:hypothetical protein